jgi:hypothetical protein
MRTVSEKKVVEKVDPHTSSSTNIPHPPPPKIVALMR